MEVAENSEFLPVSQGAFGVLGRYFLFFGGTAERFARLIPPAFDPGSTCADTFAEGIDSESDSNSSMVIVFRIRSIRDPMGYVWFPLRRVVDKIPSRGLVGDMERRDGDREGIDR